MNSIHQPRSSLLRYQALPGLAFSLLNIQEGCKLNRGCSITKEKV